MRKLPERNHYSAGDTLDEPLIACGLIAKVVVDEIHPGIAFCETRDTAEMIAHALNQQVFEQQHTRYIVAKHAEAALERADCDGGYFIEKRLEDARKRIEILAPHDARFNGAEVFEVTVTVRKARP
jgi:hypothetical protein